MDYIPSLTGVWSRHIRVVCGSHFLDLIQPKPLRFGPDPTRLTVEDNIHDPTRTTNAIVVDRQ